MNKKNIVGNWHVLIFGGCLPKLEIFTCSDTICSVLLSGAPVLDIQSRYTYSYAQSHSVFQLPQGIALCPPNSWQNQPKRGATGGRGGGYRSSSCPLEAIAIDGALLNSTWNYNSHETTTFECPSSTHRGPKVATTVKRRLLHLAIIERQMLHSQRPPNHNNCESTAVKWRLLQNRATTAKCNDREMTS